MPQGYTTRNGADDADDEGRRRARERQMTRLHEEWLRQELMLARLRIAGDCLAALLPTATIERAVGDAVAAADLLLARLRQTERE